MTGVSVLLAFSLFTSGSAEPPVFDACQAALRRALNGDAVWTMERTFGASGRTLVSSGTVSCVVNSGIVWRVTAPFGSSVAMMTEAMVIEDEEGVRTKPLVDLPHYAEIRAKTDAFAAGDAKAFEGLFALKSETLAGGGWRLVMKPEVRAMERLFTEVIVTGDSVPTNAVLKTADGGQSVIRFTERVRVP